MDKKQLHVLLIEDNPVDVILLQEILVQDTLNSFKLTTAERLQAALEILQKNTFDIILLDLGLPDSQGLRTFTQIHIAAPTIPKIVLSGLTDEVVALQTIHIGAQEYIVKGTAGFGMAARAMRYAIERQQAREALRASEERFRAMIENGLDDISLLSAEGTLLWESPAVVRNLGYAESTFVGQNIFEIVHPEDREWTSAYYANLIRSPGSQQRGEFRLRHFDGSWHWVEAIATNMLDNPSIQAIVLNYRDITERKQAEQALLESEERLNLVLTGSRLGYWDWNIETGKVVRNTRWAEMLGYTLQEIEFNVKQWTDLHHPDDRAGAGQAIQDHLEGKTSVYRAEYRMRAKDGQYKWILDQAQIVQRDAQGKPLRMSGTHTDITERKQAEEKTHQQLEELKRWYDVTLDRETRVLELKREINELLRQVNEPPRYESIEQASMNGVSNE